jgi:hypothetical protein
MLERYEQALRKIIDEEIEREKDGLATGAAVDYADYRRRVGNLEALAKVLDFMDMARTDTFKD